MDQRQGEAAQPQPADQVRLRPPVDLQHRPARRPQYLGQRLQQSTRHAALGGHLRSSRLARSTIPRVTTSRPVGGSAHRRTSPAAGRASGGLEEKRLFLFAQEFRQYPARHLRSRCAGPGRRPARARGRTCFTSGGHAARASVQALTARLHWPVAELPDGYIGYVEHSVEFVSGVDALRQGLDTEPAAPGSRCAAARRCPDGRRHGYGLRGWARAT